MSVCPCNLGREGRLLRGFAGSVLLISAALLYAQDYPPWVTALAAGAGLFVLFEAVRGWCVLRALGVNTPF